MRMDEAFLRERVEHIRQLAEKADPFIRGRLLDLAARYEKRIGQNSSGSSPKHPLTQT
jgi:hypothetical protein